VYETARAATGRNLQDTGKTQNRSATANASAEMMIPDTQAMNTEKVAISGIQPTPRIFARTDMGRTQIATDRAPHHQTGRQPRTRISPSSGADANVAFAMPNRSESVILIVFAQRWAYTATVDYLQRITIEPGKRGGKPCIRGLRITVYDVLDYLASGMSQEDILADFPDLVMDDIRACLAFAADRERRLMSVS